VRVTERAAWGAQALVRSLVSFSVGCPPTFDEHSMFMGTDAHALREEMRSHLRNISRIMDCVACEKCRLWGKLQVTGAPLTLQSTRTQARTSAYARWGAGARLRDRYEDSLFGTGCVRA
jgi:hypothetical protein